MRLLLVSLSALGGSLVFAAPPAAATPTPPLSATNAAGPVRPSASERALLEDLARRAEAELRGNILPFWLEHARDRERGGFHGQIANDLTVRTEAVRGSLLTARILWAFSAAHRRFPDPEYLAMARWAFNDLQRRFWDEQHGGVYWAVTANGEPQDTRKQTYAQAFALYACSEYFRACGDPAARARAVELFGLIEAHAHDPQQGGYFEAFARDWSALPRGTRSVMATEEAKSQNTMLHVMEAYTNLHRIWPDDLLRRRLTALIEDMVTRVRDPRTNHLHLLLAADWSPRSREFSYGHDIEFSWLVTEAAEVLGDPALLARLRPVALEIARVTRAEGCDAEGGIYHEGDARGIRDASKEWWPQAEAAVGFLNAYQISGDPAQLADARRSWDFIERRFVDREHGEWFGSLDAKNRVVNRMPKAGMWKCPYHNGRACLEIIGRVQQLLNGDNQ